MKKAEIEKGRNSKSQIFKMKKFKIQKFKIQKFKKPEIQKKCKSKKFFAPETTSFFSNFQSLKKLTLHFSPISVDKQSTEIGQLSNDCQTNFGFLHQCNQNVYATS